MQLIPLGTNGLASSPDGKRHSMCFLVLLPGRLIMLDAGTGAVRLLGKDIQQLIKPYARMDIILSHYHPDHTDGLTNLIVLPAEVISDITLWVPVPPLVDEGSVEAIQNLYRRPRFNVPLQEFPGRIEVLPYSGDFRIGPIVMKVRRQKHGGGSVAMRIGDDLAYCTDTAADDENAAFAQGVECLLHEAWIPSTENEHDEKEVGWHTAWNDLGNLAQRADVKMVMPIHFQPRWGSANIRELKRIVSLRSGHVKVVIPKEGKVYDL